MSNGHEEFPTMEGAEIFNDDDLVISGISGRFPESDNMDEFQKNLFEGIDMVTSDDRRFPAGMYGIPKRSGKLKDLSKFDAVFFGVHAKQVDVMDPQLRIMIESTFEAIIDAGINPNEIRGNETGVFIAASIVDSEEYLSKNPDKINGYELLGCGRSMFANRISFCFDFKGPSLQLDTACSSSITALHEAVLAIRNNECDSAIVGGCSLQLNPITTLKFTKLNTLSANGTCKTFDSDASGFVRSEGCVAILIQKARDAKRVYATIVSTGINTDGYKEDGITYPSASAQKSLYLKGLEKAGIKPSDIAYLEAHGAGTQVGDLQELRAIAEVFCKEQDSKPLLIGAVKSNMGHSETAAGLCSLAKIIIAMETGKMPANLHYRNPNPNIPALISGRLKVVDKTQSWNVGLVVINSLGFGGANAQAILRPNPKVKTQPSDLNKLRLLAVSGRTYEAVDYFLSKIESIPRDDELLTLIRDIYKKNISGHVYRGYSVLDSKITRRQITQGNDRKELWYVFSGMGSQWVGMGRAFMSLEPFSKAIQKCAAALMDEGVDLINLIYHGDEKSFSNNIQYTFVSIIAIQVAIVDVLKALGLYPDGIIGHSMGELTSAYADGAFTAEQTVLAAYWRGRSVIDAKVEPGVMFAAGMSWDEIKPRLPKNCEVALHNGAESVTISGPVNEMNTFFDELHKDEIFVKKIDDCNFAFHSKHVAEAAAKYKSNLERIIPVAKPRSKRWISSSVPESDWSTELAKYTSPAYHVNNFLSTVLFYEALKHIPENAVVVEIAPHCLLQSILKRNLPETCINIGLLRKQVPDETAYFLENIGKLYLSGFNPDLSVLHPPTSYPVSRGTPMLSPLVKWDHSINWNVTDFSGKNEARTGEDVIEISTTGNDAFIDGHEIEGKVIFPATGYMVLIWKTFAKINQKPIEEVPVVLEEISFLRMTLIPEDGIARFLVSILNGSGEFEICESDCVVVRGKIRKSNGLDKDGTKLRKPVVSHNYLTLNKEDIYKEWKLRGYHYRGVFRGIKSADNCGIVGDLEWENNWISFLDTMLQFSMINKNTRELQLPTRIQRVVIDPVKQLLLAENGKGIEVQMHKNISTIQCGGIEIKGLECTAFDKKQLTKNPLLEKWKFLPYISNETFSTEEAIYIIVQTLLENINEDKLNISEIVRENQQPEENLSAAIVQAAKLNSSALQCSVDNTIIPSSRVITKTEYSGVNESEIKQKQTELYDLVAGDGLLNGYFILENIFTTIKSSGFLLTVETSEEINNNYLNGKLKLISKIFLGKKSLCLFRKVNEWIVPKVLRVTEKNFDWIEDIKMAQNDAEQNVHKYLLVASGEPNSGILGLFKCLKREPRNEIFSCLFIINSTLARDFDLTDYEEQLKKGLSVNILRNGIWGSYRSLKICPDERLLNVEHAYVDYTVRGDLSSLRWIQSPLSYFRPEHEVSKEFCTIYYASLIFRDVMLATGKLIPETYPRGWIGNECHLGFEFVGRDSKGNRIMGIKGFYGLATSVLADPLFLWPIPDKWSMAEAATIPSVYATCYYALIVRGKMQPGESVLIHAGSGGVGQAAISIALHMGCDVFTTAGTQQKREFLLKHFPELKATHIGNSRDTTFEQMVLEETDGRGVDLVLNSLADEKLQASVRCLADHGRFLEIGKIDIFNNSPLGMSVFMKGTSVHGIPLNLLFEVDAENDEKLEIIRLVNEGIASGAVRPLRFTTFSSQQIEEAFRFMATGKHIGKVILKIRDEEPDKILTNPSVITVPAIPRTYMHPDKSYIIVGGLGGMGLELANWLLNRKAKAVILVSRSGVTTGYQSLCLRRWKENGFNVAVSTENPATLDSAIKLLKLASAIAPVGGIFNLAGILRDALMENQTVENFKIVCDAKIDTTISLDKASRQYCPQLDHFVVFSSLTCGFGNAGQTNYGLANSVMERICEARQAAGFPAKAIQWGLVSDVGILETYFTDRIDDLVLVGSSRQSISSCLSVMDILLQETETIVSSRVPAEKTETHETTTTIMDHIVKKIMGIKDTNSVSSAATLKDLGLDSLMSVEIKQVLERRYDISVKDVKMLTFEKLNEFDVCARGINSNS